MNLRLTEDNPHPLHFPTIVFGLPAWVHEIVRPGDVIASREDRMRMAIRLAAENVARDTGGPFGAAVFERDSGRLVSVGVNLVVPSCCSLAHAEAIALALAQQACGAHDLSAPGLPPLELVSTAQACCQCYGIVWWSGIRSLVVAARNDDVESIAGFSEGPLPKDWARLLQERSGLPSVSVEVDFLREESLGPLRTFRELGRSMYEPGGFR